MIRKLFFLFVFFAPFTSFFAISAWLRLPVVINQLLFVIVAVSLLLKNKIHIKWLQKEDVFLLIFLVFVWLSFIFGFKERRSFNHSLAYTNALIFFFLLSKYVISVLKIKSLEIARVIFHSFLFISSIIIIDFIGKNYWNVELRNLFSTPDGKISNMDYYIRFHSFRVGGVAEEPGTMALFYNIYFAVSMYYVFLKQKIRQIYLLVPLFTICHFFMLSNAGITLAIAVGIFIFLEERLKTLKITISQIYWVIGIVVFVLLALTTVYVFNIGDIQEILEKFIAKIFFNESGKSYSSSGQRLHQWSRAFSNFIKHPVFGYGPGFGVHQDEEGYLGVYATVLADIGIIGFLFFLSFQVEVLKKIMNIKKPYRGFLLFALLTAFIHFFIVSDFYHAPVWIMIAFSQLVYKEQKSNTQ